MEQVAKTVTQAKHFIEEHNAFLPGLREWETANEIENCFLTSKDQRIMDLYYRLALYIADLKLKELQ